MSGRGRHEEQQILSTGLRECSAIVTLKPVWRITCCCTLSCSLDLSLALSLFVIILFFSAAQSEQNPKPKLPWTWSSRLQKITFLSNPFFRGFSPPPRRLLTIFLSLSDFFFFPLPSFYFPPLSSSSPIRLPHTNTQPGCKSAPGTGGHLPARRRSRQECDHWFTSQKSWNWKWELGEAQFPPHHLPPPPLTPQLVSSSGLEWRVLITVFFYYLWGYCVSDHRVQRSAMPDFLIRYGTDFLQIPILCVIYFCHDKLQHVMYWYHWIDTRVSIGTSIPQHGYIDTPISTCVLFQSLWMILAMFTFFWMQSKVQWRWPDLTSVLTAGLIYTQGGAVLVWRYLKNLKRSVSSPDGRPSVHVFFGCVPSAAWLVWFQAQFHVHQ